MSSAPQAPPKRTRAAGRWFCTPHAVRRFARYAFGWQGGDDAPLPEPIYRLALTALLRESERAHFVKRLPTKAGQVDADLWRGPRPRMLRYVVGVAVQPGSTLPPLLTVLRTFDCPERRPRTRIRIVIS